MQYARKEEPSSGGSVEEFDQNWQERKEAKYNHWVRGPVQNQVQLAFRNHWTLFKKILEERAMKDCLEVGGGRGSLSSYFADHGVNCTLLDTSTSILETAEQIFKTNGHTATYIEGNAMDMPFEDNSFDVVASIGLLEHFEDIKTPIHEQIRVLRSGGTFFGYIVPERPDNVQKHYNWINKVLKFFANIFTSQENKPAPKTDIFRSDFGSERYLPVLQDQPIENIEVCGMYPLPMVSHSPEFPFSLLPKPMEWILARIFSFVLWCRKIIFGSRLYQGHPWTCKEEFGQAFLLTFTKK